MMACDAGVDEPSGGFAIYVAMPAIVISFPVGVPVSKEPVKQAGQDIVYDTQPESRDFKPRKFILNAATPGADRLRPARSSGRAARRSPCHSGLARARARAGPVAGPGPPDRLSPCSGWHQPAGGWQPEPARRQQGSDGPPGHGAGQPE